jgi:hypothetical protein
VKHEPTKQERVVLYIPREQYLQLRAKLIAVGKNASGWFREKVDEFLRKR